MTARDPLRNVRGEHRRALIRLLQQISNTTHASRWDVFQHFVELCAISIANIAPPSKDVFERREAGYHAIRKAYPTDAFALFPQALGELQLATSVEGGDVLGEVFQGLEVNNAWKGQFFTPYSVSRMMAEMNDLPKALAEKESSGEPLTICDPAIGAGSLMIACVDIFREREIKYERVAHFTGIDIDQRCVHMAFAQLALRGAPAMVIHGNALTMEQWDVWFTPAHVLLGWSERLLHHGESALAQTVTQIKGGALSAAQLPLFDQLNNRAS